MLNSLFRLVFPAHSPEELRKKYNLPNELNMRIRFTKDGYFVLTCDELPGLITEAKDGRELVRMLNDAILTYFDVPKLAGDVVYEELNIEGHGTFSLTESKVAHTA